MHAMKAQVSSFGYRAGERFPDSFGRVSTSLVHH